MAEKFKRKKLFNWKSGILQNNSVGYSVQETPNKYGIKIDKLKNMFSLKYKYLRQNQNLEFDIDSPNKH